MAWQAPWFWYQPRLRTPAALLLPLSWVYGLGLWLDRRITKPLRLPVPVVSIGNLTLGGTGKTPLVMGLARALQQRGFAVAVLLRGYGTNRRQPQRVTPDSCYAEVGDEALELAHQLPGVQVWAGSNRRQGARLAIDQGATVLLLDDGLQHWALARDLDVTVLDRVHGLGNGQLFPAGPLREPARQLARADVLVLTGSGPAPLLPWPATKPRLELAFDLAPPEAVRGVPLVAFCGIGLPQKFFSALIASGLQLVEQKSFPDHHSYAEAELAQLLTLAQAQGALLVTTVKDAQRLPEPYRHQVVPIPLQLPPQALEPLMRVLLARIGHG
jgi:tetraacyldisaccharide 4'-kinase